jgi:hypothetical protein
MSSRSVPPHIPAPDKPHRQRPLLVTKERLAELEALLDRKLDHQPGRDPPLPKPGFAARLRALFRRRAGR